MKNLRDEKLKGIVDELSSVARPPECETGGHDFKNGDGTF